MVDELAWRKFPRDTMRNEDLDYIAYLLGPELAAAPFLFFTTAYCKADDDGVFDIEDGVIFSRLMRLGSPEDVVKIASLMTQRKIITPVMDGSTIYMINDWDPPARNTTRTSRTAEERRRVIAAKIESEQKSKPQPVIDFAPAQKAVHETMQSNFFCGHDDKNKKNVDRQRERETEIEKERKETHTESSELQERACSFRGNNSPLQPQGENKAEYKDTAERTETKSTAERIDPASLAQQALQADVKTEDVKVNNKEKAQVVKLFSDFFTKNCLGYNAASEKAELSELADRICKLSDKRNPAGIVATVICTQYKTLTDTEGYYHDAPMNAVTLLKPGVYSHVIQAASKILMAGSGPNNAWMEQMELDRLQAEADRDQIYVEFNQDCIKYGVDPNAPNALMELSLRKKGAANSP